MKTKELRGTFSGEELEVSFSVQSELTDLGVPRSPTWWQIDPGTTQVEEVTLLGHTLDFAALPEALQAAILELADEVEFAAD